MIPCVIPSSEYDRIIRENYV